MSSLLFRTPPALSVKINGRRFNLLLTGHRGGLIEAAALNGKLEDTPHHCRRFLVNQPAVFVAGVFHIAENGAVGSGLAEFAPDPDSGPLFATQVPQIPFHHNV